jgi:hypothetical protein
MGDPLIGQAASGESHAFRVGPSGSTYQFLVAGGVLLLSIPLLRLWLPPVSLEGHADASGLACRALGVFGALMLLVGIRRLCAVLELNGVFLRYRRLFSAREIDVREVTHVVETTVKIQSGRMGRVSVHNLHFCRIRKYSEEVRDWITVNQCGELVFFSFWGFVRDFESTAAQKGIDVLMTVDIYSSSHPWTPFFSHSDIVRLLAELIRVSPGLSVDPRIYNRLGVKGLSHQQRM